MCNAAFSRCSVPLASWRARFLCRAGEVNQATTVTGDSCAVCIIVRLFVRRLSAPAAAMPLLSMIRRLQGALLAPASASSARRDVA